VDEKETEAVGSWSKTFQVKLVKIYKVGDLDLSHLESTWNSGTPFGLAFSLSAVLQDGCF